MSPKDEDEFVDMLYTASLHAGPVAIRYPRGTGPNVAIKKSPVALAIGKAEVIRHGQKVVIWSYGQMLPMALQLADELKKEEGIEAAVINARFAKPIDTALLELFAQSADVVVTFEDHVIKGGFGSGILEELSNKGMTTPVVRIGWPDEFIDHGKPDDLRMRYGLSVKAAKEKLQPHLVRMKGSARRVQPVAA
jgi:1-deoxy-D-xylulose-5-phosphate synthase